MDWKIPKMSSMSCSVLRNLFLSVVVFWSVTVQCKTIRRNMYIYDLYRDCCQIQFAFCFDKSNDAFSRIIYFNLSTLKVANVPYDYYTGFKYQNHIKFRWGRSEGIFCLSGGGGLEAYIATLKLLYIYMLIFKKWNVQV